MKKTILTIVMAALCLSFSAFPQDNKAVDVTSKGIQIGQKIPITAALAKYEGKLIILDFWATWCSPCIAMIPKMEALQTHFKDEIAILTVTYQTEKEVMPFLTKLQKGKASILPQITGDKELHKLFPHMYLPHYVWIDQTGTVKAITGHEEITEENIEKALSKPTAKLNLKQKHDMKVAYDKTRPLLINGNGGTGENLIYHSLLTGYTAGLSNGYSVSKASGNYGKRITVCNLQLRTLFALAFSKGTANYGANKIKVISSKNDIYNPTGDNYDKEEWTRKNTWCYELVVPKTMVGREFELMERDMEKFFPNYSVRVEPVKSKCLVLVRTSKLDKLKAKGKERKLVISGAGASLRSCFLNELMARLDVYYMQNSEFPLVNETDYTSKIDMDISASLSDLNALNRELLKYDLQFIETERNINMLVIRSTNQPSLI